MDTVVTNTPQPFNLRDLTPRSGGEVTPAPFNLRDLTPRSGVDIQPVVRLSPKNLLSSAGKRVIEAGKGAAEDSGKFLIKNADILIPGTIGFLTTLATATVAHNLELALAFPVLTSLIGGGSALLATTYRSFDEIIKKSVDKHVIIKGRDLGGPLISQREYDKLKNSFPKKGADWLIKAISNQTYHRVVLGLSMGGLMGVAAAGGWDKYQQIHAAQVNQPAAGPPGGVQNPDFLKHSNYHRASSSGSWSPTVKPASIPAESPFDAANKDEVRDMLLSQNTAQSGGGGASVDVQKVLNQIQPSIAVDATRESNSVWAASKNWLKPLTDYLKLTPQAQTYLTDAVKDVMEKYYHGLQPGQTIDFKSHIPEIVNYVKQAIQVNSPNIAGGSVDPSLKGLNVGDLQTFLSKGVDLLNQIPK